MRINPDQPQAFRLAGGALVPAALPEALGLADGRKHVIALVGGGGKTTLLMRLAAWFAAQGMRTAVMTTTRMGCPPAYCRTMEDCRALWAAGRYAVCGQKTEGGKFRAPEEDVFSAVMAEADAVLIEADGAHRRPLKIPAAHEPVIPPQADTVIAVAGLDALFSPAGDVCHRMPEARALLGCEEAHVITPEDMARVLLSPMGGRKGAGDRHFAVVLNKCDDEARLAGGNDVLRLLAQAGQTCAAMTYFPPACRTGL